MNRCFGDGDPVYERYHDEEWGRPVHSEQPLYEKLCLEGFQTGLSWLTVLRKREALRAAFAGFDPDSVAGMDSIDHLLSDSGVIRSAPKLKACIINARATVALRPLGGLPALLWSAAAVPSPAYDAFADVPATTPASTRLTGELKRADFVFVGPTTVYSLMQAHGLVNDHLTGCPVRAAVEAERTAARPRP